MIVAFALTFVRAFVRAFNEALLLHCNTKNLTLQGCRMWFMPANLAGPVFFNIDTTKFSTYIYTSALLNEQTINNQIPNTRPCKLLPYKQM